MQKLLCYLALAVSLIVLILFASDLVFGWIEMVDVAPFRGSNLLIDVVFSACALAVGLMSWFTLREQV